MKSCVNCSNHESDKGNSQFFICLWFNGAEIPVENLKNPIPPCDGEGWKKK